MRYSIQKIRTEGRNRFPSIRIGSNDPRALNIIKKALKVHPSGKKIDTFRAVETKQRISEKLDASYSFFEKDPCARVKLAKVVHLQVRCQRRWNNPEAASKYVFFRR